MQSHQLEHVNEDQGEDHSQIRRASVTPSYDLDTSNFELPVKREVLPQPEHKQERIIELPAREQVRETLTKKNETQTNTIKQADKTTAPSNQQMEKKRSIVKAINSPLRQSLQRSSKELLDRQKEDQRQLTVPIVHESSERGQSRNSKSNNTRGSELVVDVKQNKPSVVSTERPVAAERISPKQTQSKQSLSVVNGKRVPQIKPINATIKPVQRTLRQSP